jgi:hypothetical protein
MDGYSAANELFQFNVWLVHELQGSGASVDAKIRK